MSPAVTIALAEAVVVMTLLGYLVVDLLIPAKSSSRWLAWSLAPGVGAGVCSLPIFLFRRPMFTVELALLVALASRWIWKRRTSLPDLTQLASYKVSLFGVLFAGAIGLLFALSIERTGHIPHGGTDAWAIWNSHSRYLYRDGPNWQHDVVNSFHADYPLLLPLNVARLWRYAGGEDVPDLGAVLGVLFAFSAVALLGSAVAESRGSSPGLVMAFTLLTTSGYMVQGTYQEADIPLSVYFLGTIALLALYFERPERRGFLVLAGFLAGCAAWTKNEGLLFLAATSAILAIPVFWTPTATIRRLALFGVGLLLPLTVLIYFKLAIAPHNDLFEGRNYAEIVDKVFTLDRHAITFGSILSWSWKFGEWAIHPLILLSAFIVWKGADRQMMRNFGWRAGAAILAIVLAGYYSIYIFTPWILIDHIESSLPRLLMQLWPSVILMVGLAVRGAPSSSVGAVYDRASFPPGRTNARS